MKYFLYLACLIGPNVILAQSGRELLQPSAVNVPEHVTVRSRFSNSRTKFTRNKRGHVAFMGGSITEMNGYRPMVCEFLEGHFPETDFSFTDAGISSTCSTTGAFRLQHDVLSKGPVDLFFVEFAVNDDQDAAHSPQACIRGLEGIVRQCLQDNPNMDIVITYFVNPSMLAKIQAGETPITIRQHELVAERYGISSVNLAAEIAHRIAAQELTWKQFGGTHPATRGNRICADMISDMISSVANSGETIADESARSLPPAIDEASYSNGRFLSPKAIRLEQGFRREIPNWSDLGGTCRPRFLGGEMICGDEPGAVLTFDFEGRSAGAYVLAGPDAGMLEVSVDGQPFRNVELYHRYSQGLHYPRTVMLTTDFVPGLHQVRVRISNSHHEASHGTAARVLHFVAN